MTRVILDLEWNGAYSKRVGGYFNEIIEIGAVRLDDTGAIADRFDAYIRPTVSRKLTKLVTDLTGITDEQVERGTTFKKAMNDLHRFIGDGEAVLMTWSNSDLLVLMENCRYFFGDDHLPFFSAYMDLQAYAQQRLQVGGGQQIALGKFAALVGINSDDMDLHHAIDDSVLSAQVFRKVYEKGSFEAACMTVDEEFHRRVTFRTTYISDINSPLIRRADLRFNCDTCGHNLKRVGEWKYFNRTFFATFECKQCNQKFTGRVQAKRRYEGVELKKRLVRKKEKETEQLQTGTVC